MQRSLYRQTLRVEEHDDPDRPVVALAARRIEELSARVEGIEEAITALCVDRPEAAHPDDKAAMLDAVPDLRQALKEADAAELIHVEATAETGRSLSCDIAGAGFEPATFGL